MVGYVRRLWGWDAGVGGGVGEMWEVEGEMWEGEGEIDWLVD